MAGFTLHSAKDIEVFRERIRLNADKAISRLKQKEADPLNTIFEMKFRQIGFHPSAGHALNIVEQINQTFTYLCALEAASLLFDWHRELEGLVIFPGAHAPKGKLDIEALGRPGFIGGETFSAVTPTNNGKLSKDLEKLKDRQDLYRYVFFICPTHKTTSRQVTLEKYGIEVWSIWPF